LKDPLLFIWTISLNEDKEITIIFYNGRSKKV
jgi:hypothetical protein